MGVVYQAIQKDLRRTVAFKMILAGAVANEEDLRRLSAAGADLAVIQKNVNRRSPMGRIVFILFSALAELEREQVAERTSTAMLRHQSKGRRMTRPDRCPYGRRIDLVGVACRGGRWSHTTVRSVLLRPVRFAAGA
jgi:hypothetical protein